MVFPRLLRMGAGDFISRTKRKRIQAFELKVMLLTS